MLAAGVAAIVRSMGAAVPFIAAGANVAGALVGGQAQSNQYAAEASRLRVAASAARLRAGETDLQYRQQLNEAESSLLANRAGKNVGLDSPTGVVLGSFVRDRIGMQRSIAVNDQLMQADQADASAQLARKAGRAALTSSFLGAGVSAFKGIAGSDSAQATLGRGISTIGDTFNKSFGFGSVSFG